MIRYKGKAKIKGYCLVLVFLLLIILAVKDNSVEVVGSYSIKAQEIKILEENEGGGIRLIQDNIAYIVTQNSTQDIEDTSSLLLVDVQQPANPIRLGKIEFTVKEIIREIKVEDNIAYLLKHKTYHGIGNWSVAFINITNPEQPEQIGSPIVENVTIPPMELLDLGVHNEYVYVSTYSSLIIYDCSNLSSPVKVANHTSLIGDIYFKNEYLYLGGSRIRTFDLTDPTNPVLLGEVNITKGFWIASEMVGEYMITGYRWSGLQVYNLTDPYHPTICGNFEFPEREFNPGGQIEDIAVMGDKLFTVGGQRINIFDISDPGNLHRITRKKTDKQLFGVATAGNYLFTILGGGVIKIYLFSDTFLGRNLGLGFGLGVGIPILIMGVLLIRRKKTTKNTN